MIKTNQLKVFARCERRWCIYEKFLQDVIDRLHSAEFDIARKAIDDPALYRPLVEQLDLIIVGGVARECAERRKRLIAGKKDQQPRSVSELEKVDVEFVNTERPREGSWHAGEAKRAYRRYFEWYIDPKFPKRGAEGERRAPKTESGVDLFLDRCDRTAYFLDVAANNFRKNIQLAIERVVRDHAQIASTFFSHNEITSVEKIVNTGSDSHKGGKQVLLLTLAIDGQAPGRLVYKPSDVELDELFVGNTRDSERISLAEWVNQRLLQINGENSWQLPTYRFLAMNPSSRLPRSPGNYPGAQEAYGYIEYLKHLPDGAKGPNGTPHPRRRLSASKVRSMIERSDWLCTADEARTFFLIWGAWAAVAMTFSWSDVHSDNVIASNKKPYPIDLEACMAGLMNRPEDTQIVARTTSHVTDRYEYERTGFWPFGKVALKQYAIMDPAFPENEHSVGGLTGRVTPDHPVDIRSDQTVWLAPYPTGQARLHPTKNRIACWDAEKKSWTLAAAGSHLPVIARSMAQVLLLFAEERDALLQWLESTRTCFARFIPLATGSYQKVLDRLIDPLYAKSLDRTREFKEDLIAQMSDDTGLKEHLPSKNKGKSRSNINIEPAALHSSAHDYNDLINLDIPAYYHRLDEYELVNARGEMVADGNNSDYFKVDAYSLVQTQILDLDDQRIQALVAETVLLIGGRGNDAQPGQGDAVTPQNLLLEMAFG